MLLIEDDDDALIVSDLLEEAGAEVVLVRRSAEDALAQLRLAQDVALLALGAR